MEKELKKKAQLFRQLVSLAIQQELDERGIVAPSVPLKNTPGKVVRPRSPAEVGRRKSRKLGQALGLVD